MRIVDLRLTQPPHTKFPPAHNLCPTRPQTPPSNAPTPDAAANGPPVPHIIVEAVYEDGVIKPRAPLDLPPGTPITLQIATRVTAVVVAHGPRTENRPPTTDQNRDGSGSENQEPGQNKEQRTENKRAGESRTERARKRLYGGPSAGRASANEPRTNGQHDNGPRTKLEWLQTALRPSGLLASLTRADLLLLAFGLLVYAP